MGEEGEEEDGAAAAKGNLRADGIPGLGEGGSWGDWAGTAAGLSGGCSPLGSRCPPPMPCPTPSALHPSGSRCPAAASPGEEELRLLHSSARSLPGL